MPGPVSDSYDFEWGTTNNANEIRGAILEMYSTITSFLDNQPPLFILDLIQRTDLDRAITATLTEKEWRLLRFACERAVDFI